MIKHGRRVKGVRPSAERLAHRLRPLIPVHPTPRDGEPPQQASPSGQLDPGINYRVAVTYSTPEGVTRTFNGVFLARNAAFAESQARAFVIRYVRPRHIDDVTAAPAEKK
jgi:hypothetical protein